MSEIYLFRHGQACFGTKNYDRLSTLGRRQSDVLARFLAHNDIRFDAVYAGRMQRHEQTARPFCDHYGTRHPELTEPKPMAAFNEYDSSALLDARRRLDASREGKADRSTLRKQDKKAFQAYFAATIGRWVAGDFDGDPRVESYASFCRRVQKGLEQVMTRHGSGQRIAVFTSGGPISVAVKSALSLSDEKTVAVSWQIVNASLTCLKFSRQALGLSMFNSVMHLWQARDPSLITYR